MILSKLNLDWKSLKTLGITDNYSIHKLIYSLFPGNRRLFLYYDNQNAEYGKEIIILSVYQPLLPLSGTLKSKFVPDSFLDNEYYAFQIMLNPSKRQNGKIIPVIGEPEIRDWFLKKQLSWGFSVDENSLEISDIGVQKIEKGDKEITQNKASFKGVLRVTNKPVFKQSFEEGIGRGKSFGFGLLQIKKII